MRDELAKILKDRYPFIFQPLTYQSASVEGKIHCDIEYKTPFSTRGFEIGDGWFQIVDQLCAAIQAEVDTGRSKQVTCVQCKEKFGQLIFYLCSPTTVQIEHLLKSASAASSTICEHCGSKEQVTKNTTGCIKTLCDDCRLVADTLEV